MNQKENCGAKPPALAEAKESTVVKDMDMSLETTDDQNDQLNPKNSTAQVAGKFDGHKQS